MFWSLDSIVTEQDKNKSNLNKKETGVMENICK